MNIDDFKKEMEKVRNNLEEVKNVNDKDICEKAMKAYLDDVVPISKYINKGFEKIEANKLTKKEENSDGC